MRDQIVVSPQPARRSRPFLSGLAVSALRLLGREARRGEAGPSRAAPRSDLTVPLSAFQMIGVGEVRARLGDRWPALAEKVHLIAQNTISRHLLRGDVFERQGDEGYLVLFASLGPAEAEFKSRIIAREFTEHLLGVESAVGLGVDALCSTISAAALASGDRAAAVAGALARGKPPQLDAIDGPREGGKADRAKTAPHGALAMVEIETSPKRRPLLVPGLAAGAVAAVQGVFSPVWDLEQMTLLRFRAFAVETAEPSPRREDAEVDAFLADLALARAVASELCGLAARGRRFPVIVPLRATSLGTDNRRAELGVALAAMPAAVRRLVTVEICFSRDLRWTYAERAFLEQLRTLGAGWAVLVPLDSSAAGLRDAGPRHVATALQDKGRPEAESLKAMAEFGARTRALGVTGCIWGLATRPLVLGAIAAGFRFLSGPAIQADVANLANATRFNPMDLYRDLVSSRSPPGHAG